MKFYSPVGRGVALLKAQGNISYVQSDEETYDMEPRDEGKALKEFRDPDQRFMPEIGDKIELLGDRFTDKGPCTGKVTNVSGGETCVKHHDEFFWLPNDRVRVVRTSLINGGMLWIIK